jgi:hypothetical protein
MKVKTNVKAGLLSIVQQGQQNASLLGAVTAGAQGVTGPL